MSTDRLRRRVAAFGTVIATAALFVAAAPQAASAEGTRTLIASTTCTSGIVPFGFTITLNSGTATGGSSAQIPGTQTKVLTITIPSDATTVAMDSFCYAHWGEYHGQVSYPYGTWIGYTASITPGTSTVNSTWSCSRQSYLYNQWQRSCSLTGVSYG